MKTALLLFVSALTALGQLTNIPSNWSPKDSLPYINNNFTYLNTYKTGLSSCGPASSVSRPLPTAWFVRPSAT